MFKIDFTTCQHCGGQLKVIACIEDPLVIKAILAHLVKKEKTAPFTRALPPESRAPPQRELFG